MKNLVEQLQAKAQGDINATIRDRFFGAASATPVAVFPRVLRVSVHHAAKLESNYLEKLKSSIVGKLPAQSFPAVMNLEQQGLFAIGYYHQTQARFGRNDNQNADIDTDSEGETA